MTTAIVRKPKRPAAGFTFDERRKMYVLYWPEIPVVIDLAELETADELLNLVVGFTERSRSWSYLNIKEVGAWIRDVQIRRGWPARV